MHGHAHTCPVYSRHPCSQDIPCIHTQAQHHVHHTHTYTQTYTHLHTSVRTPACMCSILTSIVHMYSCILCTSHIYHTTRYMWAYTPPGTNAAHKAHHPYQPRTTNACPESSQGPWAVGAERSPSTHTPCSLGAERPGSHSRGQTRAQYTQLPESRAARQGPGSGRRRSS